jgi:hypothetical protein
MGVHKAGAENYRTINFGWGYVCEPPDNFYGHTRRCARSGEYVVLHNGCVSADRNSLALMVAVCVDHADEALKPVADHHAVGIQAAFGELRDRVAAKAGNPAQLQANCWRIAWERVGICARRSKAARSFGRMDRQTPGAKAGLVDVVEVPILLSFDYTSIQDYWSSFSTGPSRTAQHLTAFPSKLRSEIEQHVRDGYLAGLPDGPRSFANIMRAVRWFRSKSSWGRTARQQDWKAQRTAPLRAAWWSAW